MAGVLYSPLFDPAVRRNGTNSLVIIALNNSPFTKLLINIGMDSSYSDTMEPFCGKQIQY